MTLKEVQKVIPSAIKVENYGQTQIGYYISFSGIKVTYLKKAPMFKPNPINIGNKKFVWYYDDIQPIGSPKIRYYKEIR